MGNKNTLQMTGGEALAKMLSVYETQIMSESGAFNCFPFMMP